jgi:hypothetical protein
MLVSGGAPRYESSIDRRQHGLQRLEGDMYVNRAVSAIRNRFKEFQLLKGAGRPVPTRFSRACRRGVPRLYRLAFENAL